MPDLARAARPASELRAEALLKERREAFEQARQPLEDPDLLGKVGDAIGPLSPRHSPR